ncbi:CDP-diacylglycerol--glycerol-3-phosphate 3-phosphatidyltransferase [Psittacicella melopsittaci]|uniref:CDP-diacylglycerol--glycerol-3-phosphate 3-phosphatidyltransferase n=1 Tax=Psittacicella melopsittaci TaxID=2028576 RepID=A0A3A1Y6Z6_9GAMM|nr:CDP-diacylglycerol--glycerol-3-phosphate 3-phosphatidyltransferase [Psittacicella melopsittaci]RIY32998.1 CDP-diacylglycerol--glycerol-3-phosphate 3-phosphatidyltransferase [Psittacicella melopsittaci]
MRITIPTYFTLFRLVLIPLMVVIYFILPSRPAHFYTALIFLIASVTDWIDGFLARRLNAVSNFGRFLDPVADKLIVCVALVLIVYEYTKSPFLEHNDVLVTIAAIIVLCREIIVSSLREWMASLGQSSKVAVSYLGKIKTTAQMTSICFLLWRPNRYSDIYMGMNWIEYTSIALVWLAVVLTLWSMIDYLVIGIKSVSEVEKNQQQ